VADTLLLVAADADVAQRVGDYFARSGYDVRRAVSGEQAVKAFERDRPDLVVVDLELPDTSGVTVLERVRALGGAVILLAGAGGNETAVRALAASDGSAERVHVPLALAEVERHHIERTLRAHGGNRTRAAHELGISRATLINKIKAYRLDL
jgi:two-component system response regulator RegA